MKTLVKALLFIIVFCSLIAAASEVRIPETFIVKAYFDGSYAANGTLLFVKSHSTGEAVGRGFVVSNGLGKIEVFFDNDFAEGVDEGADPGEALDFYVADCLTLTPAPSSVKAEPGGFHRDFVLSVNSKSCGTRAAAASQSFSLTVFVVGLVSAFLFFEFVFILARKITKR